MTSIKTVEPGWKRTSSQGTNGPEIALKETEPEKDPGPTAAHTAGAVLVTLISFPLAFVVLGTLAGIVIAIMMLFLGIELPPPEQLQTGISENDVALFKLALSVLTFASTIASTAIGLRVFRKCHKKKSIIYFGLLYIALVTVLALLGDHTAIWGVEGVGIACGVLFWTQRVKEQSAKRKTDKGIQTKSNI